MKKIILLTFALLIIFYGTSYSQFKSHSFSDNLSPNKKYNKLDLNQVVPTVSLGFNVGLALITADNTGLAVGMFAEVKTKSFSFVPQANYWQVNDRKNFEMAGLLRLRFESVSMEPYLDGGIGINFYDDDIVDASGNKINNNVTLLGIDVGGGLELKNVGTNFSILLDAKYKIIINDPGNIKGFVITAGLKFPL